MIPVWFDMTIEDEAAKRRRRICLPLPIIYLILVPLAVLLFPVWALVLALKGVNPFCAAYAALMLLGSMSGTHVEIRKANSLFLMRIV